MSVRAGVERFYALRTSSRWNKTTVVSAILVCGVVVMTLLFLLRAQPERARVEKKPAPVETITAKMKALTVSTNAYGTVRPARSVVLQAEVGGRVTATHENLVEGGIIPAGEVLFTIDPRDYELAVVQAQAEVERANAQYALEQGNSIVAQEEFKLLRDTTQLSPLARELALRKPQLEEKKAALEAARSRLKQSQLNLERTRPSLPFRSIVLEESVDSGQYLTPQSQAARLADVSRYHVEVSVKPEDLKWIELPDSEGKNGSPVKVRQDGTGYEWIGRVVKFMGALDEKDRLARILVQVDDPLNLEDPPQIKTFPLLLGSYVSVEVEGPQIEDVFVIPRRALREENTVWSVTGDGYLSIQEVTVVKRRAEDVVVKGLTADQQVVTSSLPTMVPGMAVEIVASRQSESL